MKEEDVMEFGPQRASRETHSTLSTTC